MFSTQSDNCILISPYFDIISLFAAELEQPKIGTSGKGLRRKKKKGYGDTNSLPLFRPSNLKALKYHKMDMI